MAKTKKRNSGVFKKSKYPVIGKYIDTPTKAEVDVVYFLDNIGDCRVSINGFPNVFLKSYRIQFKSSNVKRKRKFYDKLKAFLDLSSGWQVYNAPQSMPLPLLFGLLKLRKGKQRKFVLIQSADQYRASKLINAIVVGIDNLLYLDLVNRLKRKS